jgi:FMN phosphatase YigB (HAD superfamily)
MIRVVMFDLGLTLADARNQPFPHVVTALNALATFKTADGKPLRRCLISDFTMATPPVTSAKVSAIFKQYLAVLDRTGLRAFFEPVSKRVTLSTHAGVLKPDRRIFETALRRLGASVPLQDCLFVTENAAHIAAARQTLGMQTLQFRAAGSKRYDFDDWAEAPGLIAHLAAPDQLINSHAAIRAHLEAKGIDLLTVEPAAASGVMKISAQVWRPVSLPEYDDLDGLLVALPIEGDVRRGPKGQIVSTALAEPHPEQLAEATAFVRSLATHGQIGGRTATRGLGTTHQIETDDNGNRRLVRKRFSTL